MDNLGHFRYRAGSQVLGFHLKNYSMKIEKEDLKPIAGFPIQIGYYLSGMEEVRAQLREAAADLTNAEVSAKLMPNTHSIGQLILHCAEAEWWWIQAVAAEKELNQEEARREAYWDVLLDTEFASKNYSAQFCIDELDRVSGSGKKILARMTDDDLERYFGWEKEDGTRFENSLRWILHHLIDHEAQHKGQILMIKRLLRAEA